MVKKILRAVGLFLAGLLIAFFCFTAAAEKTHAVPQKPKRAACEHRYEYQSLNNGTHKQVCALGKTLKTAPCRMKTKTVRPTQKKEGYTLHECVYCGYTCKDSVLPAEETRKESRLMGDVDSSGGITANDARDILRAVVSLKPLERGDLPYADANGDGMLTAEDARMALRCAVSLEGRPERHVFRQNVTRTPTCTKPGETQITCLYCGLEKKVALPAKGHAFRTVKTAPSTCSKPGTRTLECKTCGLQKTSSMPTSAHSWKLSGKNAFCAVCGAKPNGTAKIGKDTFCFAKGVMQFGWCKVKNAYYFFHRTTGKLVANKTVDGIRLDKTGKAPGDDYSKEKIKTFIKAKNIIASVTKPSDTPEQKREKAFRWVMKFPYAQYRLVGESIENTPGFEMLFANDIFERGSGCCGSTAFAFAFLAVECGCKRVCVADDGVSTAGHAWVTMEGNNNVYDVVFAKAKGFEENYNCAVSDYRRFAPRKTYIGG